MKRKRGTICQQCRKGNIKVYKKNSRRVVIIDVDKWGGRKSFSDSSRFRLPRRGLSWCLLFTHAQTDPVPCWGISQKFPVAPVAAADAVSPGRSCTRTETPDFPCHFSEVPRAASWV